jgi:hypothetical protein
MQRFHWAFAASSITATCGACLLTLLKTAFHDECVDGSLGRSESTTYPTAVTSMVIGAAALATNLAFLLLKSRSKRSRDLIFTICSKWQPAYFLVISLEKIILLALVIDNVVRNEQASNCSFSIRDEIQILAAACMLNLAILLLGMSVICCDLDDDFTPAMKRLAYFLFAACFVLDAIGSYTWGNTLASRANLSFVSHKFVLDNQITSCITSQVMIALHFLFVSSRSKTGRAWAYAPLRFELALSTGSTDISLAKLSTPLIESALNERSFSGVPAVVVVSQGLQNQPEAKSSMLRRMSQCWLQIQTGRISQCRVFAIPCTTNHADSASVDAELELERPLFHLKYLHCLSALAQAYPAVYIFMFAVFGLCSFLCTIFVQSPEGAGVASLLFISVTFVVQLGFFACKRHNLDRVAVKRVASSFRFAICGLFLATFFGIYVRLAYMGNATPWTVAAVAVTTLIFGLSALCDCSPRLSAFSQICISVTAIFVFCFSTTIHDFLQGTWCVVFGYIAFKDLNNIARGNLDCFINLGAYSVCTTTTMLSVYIDLFLLMAQAFISRIFAPGMSTFVNASVRQFLVELHYRYSASSRATL